MRMKEEHGHPDKGKKVMHENIMPILSGVGIVVVAAFLLQRLNHSALQREILIIIDLFCILLSAIFLFSVTLLRIPVKEYRILEMLFFLETVYLTSDAVFYLLFNRPGYYLINAIINITYIMCPVMMGMLYWRMLDYWTGTSHLRITRAIQVVPAVYFLVAAGN